MIVKILEFSERFLLFGLLILFAVSQTTAQEWVSSRVYGPFVCWGTFDLAQIESDLKELPMIYDELIQNLGLPPTEEWVEVYIFADEPEWRAFFEKECPKIPYRRALFLKKWKGRGQLFLHLSKEFAIDMRHEGTHALLHASLPEVPIWLDEGLAEYFEVDSEHRINGAEWFPLVLERARKKQVSSLAQLELLNEMHEMTAENYADSWAWVDFFLNGPTDVRDFLPLYVGDLVKKKALPVFPVTPISRRFGKFTKEPNELLTKFLKEHQPSRIETHP